MEEPAIEIPADGARGLDAARIVAEHLPSETDGLAHLAAYEETPRQCRLPHAHTGPHTYNKAITEHNTIIEGNAASLTGGL
jgi:hypothetical protein